MNVLVINSGSSSIKYQLFDMNNETVMAKGISDKIGLEGSCLKHTKSGDEMVTINVSLPDHKTALQEIIHVLTDKENGVITSMAEINAVGHRVVHGGEKISGSKILDNEVIQVINECCDLAPLHNPSNIVVIEACKEAMPETSMVAVFDTVFHAGIPDYAYMYAIPYEYYEKYKVRRYGFHGISHLYVSYKAAELMGKPIKELKMITCHLGNGASIAAVKGGQSVDTSMGLTPLEGLVMGTRSGDLDPAVIKYIMGKDDLSIDEIDQILNKKSGLLGVSGVSSDLRDVENAAANGNKKARLALEMMSYRIKKYIGAYTAAMGGLDALVFTGGIGENGYEMRERILSCLEFLGISFDAEKNKVRGINAEISKEDSKVKVFVVLTNEELAIARETVKLLELVTIKGM